MPLNALWMTPSLPGQADLAEQRQRDRAGQRQRSPGSEPACGTANVTGLVSAVGSSGVVAVAVPTARRRRAGEAANAAGAHALASRLRSVPSTGGRPTLAIAVAACPAGTVTITRSGGALPIAVCPRLPTVASIRGENGSPAQSVAW